MEILRLVDQLEQTLRQGRRMPFGGNLVVNEEECMRLIDQMRISVPSAIKESERMIAERDRIIASAQAKAEAIIATAEQEVREMVSQNYIVEQAHREADNIMARSRNDAERMIGEAQEYTLSALQQLTSHLTQLLTQSRNGIETIEAMRRPTVHQPASTLFPGGQAAPAPETGWDEDWAEEDEEEAAPEGADESDDSAHAKVDR